MVKEWDKTTANSCINFGVCSGDPFPAPTPSPQNDDCTLGKTDTLKLTTKNKELMCAKINSKKICDNEVENQEDKTVADFCISCGVCGGNPVPAFTSSPSDDDKCKGAYDSLKLKIKGDKTCAAIKKEFCKEKVKKEEKDGKKKKASNFCTGCVCGGGLDSGPVLTLPPYDCKKKDETIVLTDKGEQNCK